MIIIASQVNWMAEKVVLFGAGATGRGHIGLLVWQAGFDLVMVDKNTSLVALLQQAGKYTVRLYGSEEDADEQAHALPQEIQVSGFRIYAHLERERIAAEIADASLVLTAVFDQNLPDVAQTLALAVSACRRAGRQTPLNCIACENMMDSSSTLGKHVLARLDGADLDYCQRMFGFPDCMISRVVPRPEPDPLVIITEDYNEWTVRREAFKGDKPAGLEAMELVDNQTARLERKLFIHNGGHAVCGYFGFHRGHRYIHEALADPFVSRHVVGALDELGEVVRRKHGFSRQSIEAYQRDLGRRGAIPEMQDEVLRVVRDPLRKLSPHERLVAPALLAAGYDLPRTWIVQGIAAALKYSHPSDAQSLQLAQKLATNGLPSVLEEVCRIPPSSPLHTEILSAYRDWQVS
jgi:mannitol-1-phosphate 5-dehydrogenase